MNKVESCDSSYTLLPSIFYPHFSQHFKVTLFLNIVTLLLLLSPKKISHLSF